jgi:hypothetical protein
VEETVRNIQANRERLVLPPLREECGTELEPEMAALDRETGASGPASTFEELCKDRKLKGSGESSKDRKGKGVKSSCLDLAGFWQRAVIDLVGPRRGFFSV